MKIGLLGLGTVGTGIVEIIECRKKNLQELYGVPVEITKILVKNKDKKREVKDVHELITTDAYEILNDPSIELIIEAIGSYKEAYQYIRDALEKGKHVVTANKGVVALHMKELLDLAARNKKAFLFEASVGGGIPLLKPLRQCTLLNDFYEVKGILNGTSNFILTKMSEDKLSFDEALKIAQELGYAEADPTEDIKGGDVARKLAILASIAFKDNISLKEVVYRGIKHVDKDDIQRIRNMGFSVKLFGKAIVKGEDFSALVEPVLFKRTTQFEKVKDSFNMVSVKGDNLEELRFYGEGAGKNATANAVLCDVLDILTGACKKDFVVREKQRRIAKERLIEGKYFIRVSLGNSLDKDKILKVLREKKVCYKKLDEKNKLIFNTEKIRADIIHQIICDFKKLELSFFIARVEEE